MTTQNASVSSPPDTQKTQPVHIHFPTNLEGFFFSATETTGTKRQHKMRHKESLNGKLKKKVSRDTKVPRQQGRNN